MVISSGQIKYLQSSCLRPVLSVSTTDPEARVSGGWRGDSREILSQEGGEKGGRRWTDSARQVRAISQQAADL